jgi:hypothetical protein
MSQSEVIGAMLIAGFLLWLAIHRRLGTYWSLLLGGAAAPTAPTQSAPTPGNVPATPGAGNPAAPMGPQIFPLFPNLFPLNFGPFQQLNPPAGNPQPAPNPTPLANPNTNVG